MMKSRLVQKKIRIFTASSLAIVFFFISCHLWGRSNLGWQSATVKGALTVELGIMEFLGVGRLAFWGSFNLCVWEILAEAARLAFVLIDESLIES